jgi:phosphomannomutase
MEGVKLIFKDCSWILLRLSGTEPVARCYVESHSRSDLNAMVAFARSFIIEA